MAKSLHYGADSRCIVSKIGFEKATQAKEMANCLKFKCKDATTLQVFVEGKTVECKKDGEQKKYNTKGTRYVKCPDPKELCASLKTACPKDCSFRGRCLESKKCWCFQGFKGADCSTASPKAYKFNTLNGFGADLAKVGVMMVVGLIAILGGPAME